MRQIYGNDIPYAGNLEKMMKIALVNSHPSIEFAESLPPNVIEIGGMQIKEPKPLDKDIGDFIMKGKKGAVLMSLGSNFRSDSLGEERISAIIEAFRQLKDYNFIWKFETSDKLENLPPNVMIKPWLSQNDILAHSQIKAFISHGGMLSTLETTWHGVPVIGIPLFADQIRNLQKGINSGVAVRVDFLGISTESIRSAILEVLENPSYKLNMEKKSKLFRDQPDKPLDRAVWWCEYVMRNPQPSHLRASEFNFGLLGSHFWDVQVMIIVIILLTIYMIKKLLRKCFRRTAVSYQKKNK
jgi:UDP:flavonoid glycosyltransferase YjiC (YdhE family)